MKRGLLERLGRRRYTAVERTGIFCLGLLVGAHLVFRGAWALPPPPPGAWVSSTMLIACSAMLYTAPGFLVGALIGALFLRIHAVRYTSGGAALALLAGAIFPLGIVVVEEWRSAPKLTLMMTLVLAYPLAAGLATSLLFHVRTADLIRLHEAIRDLGLPRELSIAARRVARHTRLRKDEQVAVAREVAERFAEGLAAGRTPVELRAGLGDLRRAASHVRSVKLRQRPLAWRAWRGSVQAVLWVSAIGIWWYVYLFLLFNLVDSERSAHATDFERTWPHYRAGLEQLHDAGVDEHWDALLSLRPGEPGWSGVAGFLGRNQKAFDELRAGAGPSPPDAEEHGPRTIRHIEKSGPRGGSDWITPLLRVGRLLAADVRRAVDADDAVVAAADFDALFSLCRQCRRLPGGGSLHLAYYFDQVAGAELAAALLEKPALFPEPRLAEWAGRMESAAETPAAVADRLRGVLRDILAGLYGAEQPRGRVAPAAIRDYLAYERWRGQDPYRDRQWESGNSWNAELEFRLLGPLVAAVVLGPSAMAERGDALLGEVESYLEAPPRERGPSPFAARLESLEASRFETARLLPLAGFCRSFDWIVEQAPGRSERRDATRVAIALARFHSRNGAWPESLAALVPALLPEVPLDVFDGRPLRYRRLGSAPIVYSVGPDGVDDGGWPLSFGWKGFEPLGQPGSPIRVGRDRRLLPVMDAEFPNTEH